MPDRMGGFENKWTLTINSATDLIVSTLFSEEKNRVEQLTNWDRIFAFLGLDCRAIVVGNGFVVPKGKDKKEAMALRRRVETTVCDLDIENAKETVRHILEEHMRK